MSSDQLAPSFVQFFQFVYSYLTNSSLQCCDCRLRCLIVYVLWFILITSYLSGLFVPTIESHTSFSLAKRQVQTYDQYTFFWRSVFSEWFVEPNAKKNTNRKYISRIDHWVLSIIWINLKWIFAIGESNWIHIEPHTTGLRRALI